MFHLAIDIGASSGRHIVGWLEKGAIQTKEVYRFPNGTTKVDGHLTWAIEKLENEVRVGIDKALALYPDLKSLSIDTWGVDYVLLKGDVPVLPCYAYRDNRTEKIIPKVHELVDFETLYERTGIQFQPFNTIYQLSADNLEGVTDFLMIPEYLMYRLTGVKAKEYTNATTTGLVNALTKEFDEQIINALGLPLSLFPTLLKPGTIIGQYKNIEVVLCATHDTASAVEGIPMKENNPYISSGTWSLLGVKTEKAITDENSRLANYSNEGGVGYNRYQKNIMGMWLINKLKDELCPHLDYEEIVLMAQNSHCNLLVDANAECFMAPSSMKVAFDNETNGGLQSLGDYFRCAYRSLAKSYKCALDELEVNTGNRYDKLTIVGGGAKNQFLNDLTREMTGKEVIALPIEATALGNLKLQMEVFHGL